MPKLTPRVRAQAQHVYTLTSEMQVRLRVLEEAHASLDVQVKPSRGQTTSGDIETLAFLVMMQAAKSAQDDLKAIMEGVREINSAKAALREKLRPGRRTGLDFEAILQFMLVVYGKQIDAEAEELLNDIDSLSEMGEMESLRLQMAMDRMSKMMSALSNLLKKMSDTSSQLVQNMK